MARPKNPVPSYRHHKPSDTARCWVGGRWLSLGVFDSPESRAEYARVLAELAAAPAAVPAKVGRAAVVTVNQVLLAFWRHALEHYRRADGTHTNEVAQYRQTFRLVRGLYGHTPAGEFGPVALKALRQKMVDAGWCRRPVNQRVGRVKRVFKWAAAEELVPAPVYQALTTLAGLQAGRTAARETDPVKPVGEDVVTATLPFLRPPVRAMVQVQLLTGMRPGEVCRLRPADVDTSAAVWLYRPGQFKTRHRGKSRVVAVGPKAQAVLAGFAPADPDGYYFSPERSVLEFRAERAAGRKTPLYPSHRANNEARRVKAPARTPGRTYTVAAYGHAVARACAKAGVPRWFPNQLRHAHGTAVRAKYGLEAAQVALGHERANVTEVYAERNLALAVKVAAEAG